MLVMVVLREEVEVDLVQSKSLPLTLAPEDDTPTVEHVQVHPSSVAEQDTQTVVRSYQNSAVAAAAVVAAVVVVVAVEVSAATAE